MYPHLLAYLADTFAGVCGQGGLAFISLCIWYVSWHMNWFQLWILNYKMCLQSVVFCKCINICMRIWERWINIIFSGIGDLHRGGVWGCFVTYKWNQQIIIYELCVQNFNLFVNVSIFAGVLKQCLQKKWNCLYHWYTLWLWRKVIVATWLKLHQYFICFL